MKLPLSFWVFAIAGFIAPVAVADQQEEEINWGQKTSPVALHASGVASGVSATNYLNFSAKVDTRGFINVWKLRHDVALLEPLKAKDLGDKSCGSQQEYEGDDQEYEGDADRSSLNEEEFKRREMAAAHIQAIEANQVRECVAKMNMAHQVYADAFQAFNATWLPALIEAMHRGDLVAEVILRQCSTTPVIDRSNIESTCTNDRVRKKIAVKRLKEIGFAPAFELTEEPGYWEFDSGSSYSTQGRLALQEIILYTIAEGNLGNIPNDATGCQEEPDFNSNNRLIQEALFRVRQAFTFSWRRDETDFLKLVRQPIRSKELTWGPATLTTLPDRIFLTSISIHANRFHYAGGLTRNAMQSLDPCWGMGLHFADISSDVKTLVDAEQASIDRYLTQDPRWGVFLMKRIGHHEWLPYDMEPEPTKLGSEWMGHWVVSNSYEDFVLSGEKSEASADIYLDGATPRISIKSNLKRDAWPYDISGCTLRDSGGVSLQGILGSINNSVLGDLDNIVTSHSVGDLSKEAKWINKETGLVNGLEPFGEKQGYRQILMQCEDGESTGSEVVRFLLLGKDTLVEVAVPYLRGGSVYVRHFKRPASLSSHQGFITRAVTIQKYAYSRTAQFIASIILLLVLTWGIVIIYRKLRRR
ncbi:MAG: hypothetical protein PHU06_12560 [Gallionella sp.]|nr:hypothetical protein [Gallionella sp.]MDD4959427.1 hypothetical protein [Gallionella sp.]